MSYYSPISEEQDNLLIYLYRLFSIISFIPYLSFLIVCFFGKTKENFLLFISLQLCISSMMHSASYLFPSMSDSVTIPSKLCLFQALLNSLSDLSSISTATANVFIAYLNLTNPKILKSKKKIYFLLTCICCWFIPFLLCIVIFVNEDVHSGENFNIDLFSDTDSQ